MKCPATCKLPVLHTHALAGTWVWSTAAPECHDVCAPVNVPRPRAQAAPRRHAVVQEVGARAGHPDHHARAEIVHGAAPGRRCRQGRRRVRAARRHHRHRPGTRPPRPFHSGSGAAGPGKSYVHAGTTIIFWARKSHGPRLVAKAVQVQHAGHCKRAALGSRQHEIVSTICQVRSTPKHDTGAGQPQCHISLTMQAVCAQLSSMRVAQKQCPCFARRHSALHRQPSTGLCASLHPRDPCIKNMGLLANMCSHG